MERPTQIISQPGIRRDGTDFASSNYLDGEWCRFQRGLPRKMGGYRSINKFVSGLPRALHEFSQDRQTYLHLGSANLLERLTIDRALATSVVSDRTPTSGFTADPANMWQFAASYDTTNGNQIVAQVAPNLDCICNSAGGALFVGDLLGTGALTEVTTVPGNFNVTGGVAALPPYTFAYGSDGYVAWSVPNGPADFTGTGAGNAYVTAQKIIRGIALRGGPGNSPSGLFWAADALIRASFVGGTPVFQFDTISTQTSILSANSVIEHDGIFYWAGVDRFLMFNGVVREIPNDLNVNFFYDNLNAAQRQKVFAFKVPRFSEIWWCFPKGAATEPNHAVIYNVREQTWYDTPLPGEGRGAGIFPPIFRRPLLTGVEPDMASASAASIDAAGTGYSVGELLVVSGGERTVPVEITVSSVDGSGGVTGVSISNAGRYTVTPDNPVSVTGGSGSGAQFDLTFINPYKTWVHEIGSDAVDGSNISPIPSSFQTSYISLATSQDANNKSLQVLYLEPDFVQQGDMTAQVIGRANARAPSIEGERRTFVADPSTPEEQILYFKEQRRLLSFRFESNTMGGDYEMGRILAQVQPTDGKITG